MGKATITDVARRAGVSAGTVSNVLNGTRPVTADKRERVMAAIDALAYVPDASARSLRSHASRLVGLCVPFADDPHLAPLLATFADAFPGHEVIPVFGAEDPAVETARVRALLAQNVRGIVLLPSAEPAAALALIAEAGVPAVLLARPQGAAFDEVSLDEEAAALEATARLLAKGHRRILFTAQRPQLGLTRARLAGFRAAMDKARIPGGGRLLAAGDTEEAYRARLAPILTAKDAPTAIIVANARLALWTLRAFRALGVRHPEAISLLTLTEPDWSEVAIAPLATVRTPFEALARQAWERLAARVAGDDAAPQRCILSANVEIRGSVIDIGRT
ncbi:LacI family transcriptional regulator [Acuticoccus sp. M5D2P5]|uniref:LacI family DNA-binding transcriptional regulator n=1 Tax=Acuticoccus kalidii TaxID=2910977 RepID=UPI001F252A45|nr:LacI family DNA-binding transcriptional regulator [Acuticoccus kalidii]MCF3934527.1 LacI family transcriptional regulator [Acuticoccus kalidii]